MYSLINSSIKTTSRVRSHYYKSIQSICLLTSKSNPLGTA